ARHQDGLAAGGAALAQPSQGREIEPAQIVAHVVLLGWIVALLATVPGWIGVGSLDEWADVAPEVHVSPAARALFPRGVQVSELGIEGAARGEQRGAEEEAGGVSGHGANRARTSAR